METLFFASNDVSIDECKACRGLWFEKGEAQQIKRLLTPAASSGLPEAVSFIEDKGRKPAPGENGFADLSRRFIWLTMIFTALAVSARLHRHWDRQDWAIQEEREKAQRWAAEQERSLEHNLSELAPEDRAYVERAVRSGGMDVIANPLMRSFSRLGRGSGDPTMARSLGKTLERLPERWVSARPRIARGMWLVFLIVMGMVFFGAASSKPRWTAAAEKISGISAWGWFLCLASAGPVGAACRFPAPFALATASSYYPGVALLLVFAALQLMSAGPRRCAGAVLDLCAAPAASLLVMQVLFPRA